MRKQHGVTLIELLIVIVIMSIISVVVGRILLQGYRTMLTSDNVTSVGWQGLIALSEMTNDIHRVRSTADVSTIGASQLTFTDVSGNSVQYIQSGSNLLRNGQVLASGIQNLSFTYLNAAGSATSTPGNVRYIRVSLTLTQSGLTLTMPTMVGIRV